MSKIPPAKRFKQKNERIFVQAQQIWLILVSMVENSKPTYDAKFPFLVPYGRVALAMGYDTKQAGRAIGRQLGIVGMYCKMNDMPPINVIVVTQETREPGDEVLVRDGRSVKQEQSAVMEEDWYSIRVPTVGTFRKVWEAIQGKEEDPDDDE